MKENFLKLTSYVDILYMPNFLDRIKYQEKELDFIAYNESFSLIEEMLTEQYVKIRALEAIAKLTRDIMHQKIMEQKVIIDSMIREIEALGDAYIENEYAALPVEFKYSVVPTELNPERNKFCEVRNNRIMLAAYETEPAKIIEAKKTSEETTYQDNIDEYPEERIYRTHYLIETDRETGVGYNSDMSEDT